MDFRQVATTPGGAAHTNGSATAGKLQYIRAINIGKLKDGSVVASSNFDSAYGILEVADWTNCTNVKPKPLAQGARERASQAAKTQRTCLSTLFFPEQFQIVLDRCRQVTAKQTLSQKTA